MLRAKRGRTHAIVIGGGIAGLLAARVLVKHFEQVTLIERDHYPDAPVFRAGVPQGRHIHVMLLRGQRALEELFPGFTAKLLAQGAIERTYGAEGDGASLYYYGERCPQIPPVLQGWNCSRPLLEWQIRQELVAYPNLQIQEGQEVVHLLPEKMGYGVRGVQLRTRAHTPTPEAQELYADLVVDASGSSSRIATWFEELGEPLPRERTIHTWVHYATRRYLPPEQSPWKEIAIQTARPGRPAGAVMEIEGGYWLVSLTGVGKERAHPKTEEDFVAFAQALAEPALSQAVSSATPVSPVYGYRKVENRQRRLRHPLAGFIVLGDALCSFNPLYGQGMTIAVLEAQLLDICFRKYGKQSDVIGQFQKKIRRLLAFPWQLAATADRAASLASSKGLNYTERLIALLPHDQKALLTFLKVIHMVQSPLALFHPMLLTKVFIHTWKHKNVKRKIR